MCSESEARQIIGVEDAGHLVDIIEGGWQQYVDEGRRRRSTARANVVWDNMMDIAESKFAMRDDVQIVPLSQSQGYVFRKHLLVQFKMLDRKNRPQNVTTKTRDRLAESGFFDGLPAVVTCGYRLDATESEVAHVRAVRHVKNSLEWMIDLRELAAGVLAPAAPIFGDIGTGTSFQVNLPSIRPAIRKEEGEQT